MSGGVLKGLWPARLAWAGILLAVAGQAAAAPSKSPRPLPPAMPASYYGMEEADRDDGLMREIILGMHNEERESLGLPPLAWDSALAADAARYAAQMAQTNIFRHSARASRATPSGENLWMGSRGLYDYEVMVGSFLDEKRYFRRNGTLPDLSTTGRWEDVGHYTQIIWRGTRKVGCALAEGQSYDYLVCRYFPAGNVFGRNPLDRDDATPSQYAGGGR
ncbi:Fis family transcriptional regulator [Sphingobium chungbukense]|uniref:Fis family transcriptional regulator n=2 Tax=Sphingobium chungbukense TaxID=56193 RepID=A0A0M3AW95_9SPHN|nr:CAP domain-containing protein [Sphingobium sp. LB126]KKW94115.1 Fis family transcriptional regulator [Sphingobium chungbukense]